MIFQYVSLCPATTLNHPAKYLAKLKSLFSMLLYKVTNNIKLINHLKKMIRRSGYIFNSYNVKSRITNVVVDCIRNIILRRAYENARNENVIAVITGGIIHD